MKRNNRTADEARIRLALTQEMMASWLGVGRSSVALAERGNQPLTSGVGLQSGRLSFALLGQVYDGAGGSTPAPLPLPMPPPEALPIEDRLAVCRYQLSNLHFELAALRRRAAPYETRLAVAPALRAYAGPVPNPEREARWLSRFEEDAAYALRYQCGAGPQRLLEARIAGLEHETALLEEMLAALPPAP